MPLPYDIVREKVIEACPEIMELKFGCKIKNIKTGSIATLVDNCNVMGNEECDITLSSKDSLYLFEASSGDIDLEILGREIRLSDILRTIRNIERPLPGAMTDIWWNKQERRVLDLWDMEHDSLSWHATHQPSTVAFLGDLLGK